MSSLRIFSVGLQSTLRFSRPVFLQSLRDAHAWRRKRYYRGVYFLDGMECHKDDVLVRQWKLNYYPGLNVNFIQEVDDKVLRASCDGTVMITTEKIDPDFACTDIETAYDWRKEQVEAGVTKLTFNVIAKEETGKFLLKETI